MKLKQLLLLFAISALIFSTISVNGNSDFTNENDLELNIFPPDNYADEVIDEISYFYSDGENALGAPDGEYARIFEMYTNGFVYFDLGRYETCADSTGDDLRVHINNGTYIIKIGNDLSSHFTTLGQSNTTMEFDIDSVGFIEVRYVMILSVFNITLELDAIEVINLYTVVTDNDNPVIDGPEDFWIYDNETELSFVWTVSDATKWNYSILVNSVEIETEEWYETSIEFDWNDISPQNLTVTLILFDYFGNQAVDTVLIEIRTTPERSSFFLVLIPLIPLYIIRKKLKK